MKNIKIWRKFVSWQLHKKNNYYFLLILSILVGLGAGIMAVIIKIMVKYVRIYANKLIFFIHTQYLYFLLPILGLLFVYIFIKFILKRPVNHGIPSVLYAISQQHGFMKRHNLFSSVVTSTLTVGFGGSVGLEGPTVATGGAIGATLGSIFKLEYQQKIMLLGAASAGAMSAIFKAPITGVVFAIEVIMLDLTTKSTIPILLASVSGTLTTYYFTGTNFLYNFQLKDAFELSQIPYFVLLGLLCGFVALYFSKMYIKISEIFHKIKKPFKKMIIGAGILGLLIFLFPALYGEGYEYINNSLNENFGQLYQNKLFSTNNTITILILLLTMILLKVVATSLTFGAGGVGGVFAPTLFTGANTGLFIAILAKHSGYNISYSNSALVAMAGLIAGVLQAPLTGIFLIGEITGGYGLLFPLMITVTMAYIIVKIFQKNNLYSVQLAKRKELLTHDADKNTLIMLPINKIIEKNFQKLHPKQTLKDIVKAISKSKRNLFPVVDEHNTFLGLISIDSVRKIMFKHKLYNKIKVKDIMYIPNATIDKNKIDTEIIAEKLQKHGVFNIVVLNNGKYEGFISKANFFSHYRKLLKKFAAD